MVKKLNTPSSKRKKLRIRSGTELILNPVPSIPYRILGLLRVNGGRMSLTGQYKMMKSLLAHDLGFKVAAGEEWLGFKTIRGNVLYVNLEISEEKFQERTQDFQSVCEYDTKVLHRFSEVTILDRNVNINSSTVIIQRVLDKCKETGFKVDMLILDPRARLISGSENEEVIIKRFCDNVDTLLTNNPGLSVVIVTHMGKDASKGAIGHSRYSGWLDTEIKIVKSTRQDCDKLLEIVGRDTERTTIALDFDYPMHYVVAAEQVARKTKIDIAKEFILSHLKGEDMTEQQLRTEAMGQSISDYAFHTAIRELKDKRKIIAIQASGRGNRKVLKLVKRNDK
ncbi:AAA family ATPase [Chloroflexota bacterium]